MSKFVSQKAIKKVNKVFLALTKQPKKFNMSYWATAVKDYKLLPILIRENVARGYFGKARELKALKNQAPPCGTIACLAGQALITLGKMQPTVDNDKAVYSFNHLSVPEEAAKLLGISEDAADKLFFPDYWPRKFRYALKKQKAGTKGYLNVAKRRFAHLVKTGQ